jgi:outer membrane protein
MKKLKYFFLITISFISLHVIAQKTAFVDTQYILKNMPEYANAQKQLDDIAAEWQKEVDAKFSDVDNLRNKLASEQVLLTDDMKQQRQKEIDDKEKEARDFQSDKFGYQGELFKKRQELIQPIQDKVYDAIQKIATSKQYDFVLDKSAGSAVLWANSKDNISDLVLQSLGYASKTATKPTDQPKQTTPTKTATTTPKTTLGKPGLNTKPRDTTQHTGGPH